MNRYAFESTSTPAVRLDDDDPDEDEDDDEFDEDGDDDGEDEDEDDEEEPETWQVAGRARPRDTVETSA